MTDPIEALVSYLNARLTPSVYGGSVPGSYTDPETDGDAILVRHAGEPGNVGRAYQTYGDTRVDVFCYSATDLGAVQLHRTVYRELKGMRRNTSGGMVLHWARPSGGGGQSVDEDTGWDQVVSSWIVVGSDVDVA